MNGIIIINKHKGCTSHDIVYKVRKIANTKVGHTGTLDPMATGVLPLLIGKGTQCSKYLINHDKIYQVKLQLGQKTDTADSEGSIIEEKQVKQENMNIEMVEKILKSFIGKQEQIPPMYSAIKVKGKKLYEYARKGQTIDIQARKIEIYDIELIKINIQKKQIEFKVSCSKGTYIRSLCEDIAIKFGTVGHMCELKRIQVGKFNINNSITLGELENHKKDQEWIKSNLISIEELFKEKKAIELGNTKLKLFLNGVQLTQHNEDEIYRIYNNGNFIGIGVIKNKLLKRDIII